MESFGKSWIQERGDGDSYPIVTKSTICASGGLKKMGFVSSE
jgi:hypothetical protein